MGKCCSKEPLLIVEGVDVGFEKADDAPSWRGVHQLVRVKEGTTSKVVLKKGKVTLMARRLEGMSMDLLVHVPPETFQSFSDEMKTAMAWKSEEAICMLIRSVEEVEEICKEATPFHPELEEVKGAMKRIFENEGL